MRECVCLRVCVCMRLCILVITCTSIPHCVASQYSFTCMQITETFVVSGLSLRVTSASDNKTTTVTFATVTNNGPALNGSQAVLSAGSYVFHVYETDVMPALLRGCARGEVQVCCVCVCVFV